MEQSLMDKLTILADSAKYDVACTSSGASRAAQRMIREEAVQCLARAL